MQNDSESICTVRGVRFSVASHAGSCALCENCDRRCLQRISLPPQFFSQHSDCYRSKQFVIIPAQEKLSINSREPVLFFSR